MNFLKGNNNPVLGSAINKSKTLAKGKKKGLYDSSIEKANIYQRRYSDLFTGMGDTNNLFSNLAGDINAERGKAYTDTTEGKSFLATLLDNSKAATQNATNTASLMGLSPEALLAMQGNINKTQSGSIRDMISGSDARRQGLTSAYSGVLANLMAGQQGLFGAQYGIDRDILNTQSQIKMQKYAADQQRKAGNAQAIGQGLGALTSLVNPLNLFGGGKSTT